MGFAAIAAAGAVLGGIAGGQKDSVTNYQESSGAHSVNLRDFNTLNQGRSQLEENAYNGQLSSYADLQKLIGMGPGENEVSSNNQFQNSYASQLQQLMQSIANPNQQQNYSQAQQAFAPQQTALNQQFQDQNVQSNRLAARLGRAGNDPIMRNKMMQEQTRQQTMLNSQIGAYGQQLPAMRAEQIMGVGNQLSNLRQGLATQAMNNRQTLLGMGQQLAASERQYRLGTALTADSGYTHGENLSGGGTKGAISGGMKGFSSMGGMGAMGGGGGGSSGGGGGGGMMSLMA